jgi:hypothetical protein
MGRHPFFLFGRVQPSNRAASFRQVSPLRLSISSGVYNAGQMRQGPG